MSDGEWTVNVDGTEYRVLGEVIMNDCDGQVVCPNCDSSDAVTSQVPGLDEPTVFPVLANGNIGNRALAPHSPIWIAAVAMAEGELQMEKETRHVCTRCVIRI